MIPLNYTIASALVCFGLPWSTLICLGLLELFQITIERLKCLKAISGMGWDWDRDWKSLWALILRAPLCGANKGLFKYHVIQSKFPFFLCQHYSAFAWWIPFSTMVQQIQATNTSWHDIIRLREFHFLAVAIFSPYTFRVQRLIFLLQNLDLTFYWLPLCPVPMVQYVNSP